ncbi:hypothetical protein WDW89_04475 [Deltaproteobacteria bacterium TL4]
MSKDKNIEIQREVSTRTYYVPVTDVFDAKQPLMVMEIDPGNRGCDMPRVIPASEVQDQDAIQWDFSLDLC